jgi:hypothetical protein
MFRPAHALQRTRLEGSYASSLGYAVLSLFTLVSTTALFYLAVLLLLYAYLLGKEATRSPDTSAFLGAMSVGTIATSAISLVLTALVVLLVLAAVDHQVLRFVGARRQPFKVTLRASALSLAPALCGLVPFVGLYVFPVWMLGLRAYLYKRFYRTNLRNAVLGALVSVTVLGLIWVISVQ